MSRRPGRLLASAGAALLLTGLTACSPDPPTSTPAPAVTAKLSAAVPDGLSIGVVVSVTSAPGEGAEWRDAAEGARVAAQRFALGGTTVTLVPVNDKGTADGAAAAVKTLADRGVAGVVLATSGPHIDGALDEATTRHLPVLLPYAWPSTEPADGVWSTGPDRTVADRRLVEAMEDRGLTRPFLIDAGGGRIDGLAPIGSVTFGSGDDPAQLARSLAARQKSAATAFDAVAVSGPATLQGRLVSALQGVGVDTTTVLSPDALSPDFPRSVVDADGSLTGNFVSAGLDEGDAGALEPTEAGRALAGYFSGLSLAAGTAGVTDLFGERPFADLAGSADVRSHDAVVALVRAAATARSSDPTQVGQALSGLTIGPADGLAGPPLDFTGPRAVAGDAVVAVAATPVSPGVRPTSTTGSSPAPKPAAGGAASPGALLFWYPAAPG